MSPEARVLDPYRAAWELDLDFLIRVARTLNSLVQEGECVCACIPATPCMEI